VPDKRKLPLATFSDTVQPLAGEAVFAGVKLSDDAVCPGSRCRGATIQKTETLDIPIAAGAATTGGDIAAAPGGYGGCP
jgi:hypothetical protein